MATTARGSAKKKAKTPAPAPVAAPVAAGPPSGADVFIRGATFYFPESGSSTLALVAKEKPHKVFALRERRQIGSRYVRQAGPDETPSVLATAAAQKLLEQTGIDPESLDMVVTASVTPPDFDMWSMPAKIARNLGATRAECFGFGEAACCSAFAAIRMLTPMMRAPDGPARVLLVAGCVTPGGHFFEPATIYGDGAGAILLERAEGGSGLKVVRADYYTHSRYVDAFGAEAGVKKLKAEGKLEPSDWTVRVKISKDMDELISTTAERGAARVRTTLAKEGWTPRDLRWLIGDNVAAVVNIDMAAQLEIPEDRILLQNCTRYGHAWVVDLFVNLATVLDESPLAPGERVACVGVGQGENWGVVLLEKSEDPS